MPGVYPITYSHTNTAGLQSSVLTRVVTVVDTTAPVVVLLPVDTYVEANGVQTNVVLPVVQTHDIVDGYTNAIPDNAGPFLLGTHRVNWAARDSAGNSVSSSAFVVVQDTTAPQMPVVADVNMPATGVKTQQQLPLIVATDAVDGMVIASSDVPVAGFSIGITAVHWVAVDRQGNSSAITQNVIVSDGKAPAILAPPSLFLAATDSYGVLSSDAAIQAFLGGSSATDNVDGVIATISNNAPASFPVGTTTVTFTAVDVAGNSGTASSDVVIASSASAAVQQSFVNDRDGDGVVDISDAFPDDAAASVDSDSDGYPDAWNATAAIGTVNASVLTIDQFPKDKAYHADSDGDLMADGWEMRYFSSLMIANLSTDFDGDGMSDVSEFIAGSDPTFKSDIAVSVQDAYGAAGSIVVVPITIRLAAGVQADAFVVNINLDTYALTLGTVAGGPAGWSVTSTVTPTLNGLGGQLSIVGINNNGSSLAGSLTLFLPVTLPISVANSVEYAIQVDASTSATSNLGNKLAASTKDGRLRVAIQAPMLFSMHGGWNYIAIFLDPGKDSINALLNVLPETQSIWGLSQDGSWLSYQVVLPAALNTLASLQAGHAYWIQVASAVTVKTIRLQGITPLAVAKMPMHAGWNSVVLTASDVAMTPNVYLQSVAASQIWSYNGGVWSSFIGGSLGFLNSLQTLQVDVGYYVLQ